MRLLLDTCVLSELTRPAPAPGLTRFLEGFDEERLFVSVVSVGEIAKGVALLEEGTRKRALAAWLLELERSYGGRLLPIDAETARLWGEITAAAQRKGRIIGAPDGLIGATALRHGMTLVTRNIPDFEPTGARLINPWSEQGER